MDPNAPSPNADAPAADLANDAPADAVETTALGGATAPADAGGADSVDAGGAADDAAADGGDADAAGEDTVAAADADDAAEVAPYEGLVAPEGTTLEAEDMALAAPLMRSLGIEDGEAAQSFINSAAPIIAGIVERVGERMATQMAENRAELTRTWNEELRADPDIGGARYDETLAVAASARDRMFSPAFNDFLNESGLGNHVEMVRGLAQIGRAIADDSIHIPEGGRPKLTTAEKLYDPAFHTPQT